MPPSLGGLSSAGATKGELVAPRLPAARPAGHGGSPAAPWRGQRVHVTPDAPPSLGREGSEAPGEPRAPAPFPRRGYIWRRICIAANRRTWAAGEILGGARARGAAANCHTQARRREESPGRRLFLEEPASHPSGFGPSGRASSPPPAPSGDTAKGGMGTTLLDWG